MARTRQHPGLPNSAHMLVKRTSRLHDRSFAACSQKPYTIKTMKSGKNGGFASDSKQGHVTVGVGLGGAGIDNVHISPYTHR